MTVSQTKDAVKILRDTYAITPGSRLYRKEFGNQLGLEKWYNEGLSRNVDLREFFNFDPVCYHYIGDLGWSEAAFVPAFEEKILEDRGEHEVVQDFAGRHVLCFKGRRTGFMPEFLDHPVKDMKSWQEKCKWRLDPELSQRWEGFEAKMSQAKDAAGQGLMMTQLIIGGYMYLRSLIGPEGLLYAFYDMPEVLHDCMQTWLKLADYVTAKHQEHVTLDELFFGEDICYNHGSLCSPDHMKEFLFPYYQQLISNIKSRQLDKSRHLYVQIDTDGNCPAVIDIYRKEIGMDVMSPFEVASGCDVVEVGKKYPWLVLSGGIDKRELAKGKDAIDRMLERIIPPMRERGGYIPTCDHQVPEEVSLENYLHYRKRAVELGG